MFETDSLSKIWQRTEDFGQVWRLGRESWQNEVNWQPALNERIEFGYMSAQARRAR
jgi:hypothetical protein